MLCLVLHHKVTQYLFQTLTYFNLHLGGALQKLSELVFNMSIWHANQKYQIAIQKDKE